MKSGIKSLAGLFGVGLINTGKYPDSRTAKFIRNREISLVLDVGGNEGQFGDFFLRNTCRYTGDIISFEPLPDAYAVLSTKARADGRWTCHNIALGEAESEAVFNVAGNSQSSSLLPMTNTHVHSAPKSQYVSTINVPVKRLDKTDDVMDQARNNRSMLKIDTQGFEMPVLRGASSILHHFEIILAELSLVELYRGESLIEEVIAYMRENGFKPISIHQGFSDAETWHQLQADVVFART